MSSGQERFASFENSAIFNDDRPMSLSERLGYFKQLIFSKTRLEFRLLWNKVFQREDEELGWLLNPYRESARYPGKDATMMSSFNKNVEDSYQYNNDDFGNALGREKVTMYNRGIAKKADNRKREEETKSLSERTIEIARYMGMGVYMTSTSFPSPFFPLSDAQICDNTYYGPQNMYTMSRIW